MRAILLVLACVLTSVVPAGAAPVAPGLVVDDSGADQSYGPLVARRPVTSVSVDLTQPTVATGAEAPSKDACASRPNCALIGLELRPSNPNFEAAVTLIWPGGPDVDLDLYLYRYVEFHGIWVIDDSSGELGSGPETVVAIGAPGDRYMLGVSNGVMTTPLRDADADGFRLQGSITYFE